MLTATQTVYLKADGRTPVFEETEGEPPKGAASLLVRKGSPISQELAETLGMTPKRAASVVQGMTTLELIARSARREGMTDTERAADTEAAALHAAATRRRDARASGTDAHLGRQARTSTLIEAGADTEGVLPDPRATQGDTEGLTTSHAAEASADMHGGERTPAESQPTAATGTPGATGTLTGAAAATGAATGAQTPATGASGNDLDNDGRDEAGVGGTKKALTQPPATTGQPPTQTPPLAPKQTPVPDAPKPGENK